MVATIMIISERRLLAEAYANLLTERGRWSVHVGHSTGSLRHAVTREPQLTLILDVERLIAPVADVVSSLEEHRGRRCGIFDVFTASIAERAFELGARHLIAASASADEIVAAVTKEQGTTVTRGTDLTREELARLSKLSGRELEVLHLIARGQSASRIAATLGITSHTVETHRRRAMRKLDTAQQSQAVALLARAGAFVTTTT